MSRRAPHITPLGSVAGPPANPVGLTLELSPHQLAQIAAGVEVLLADRLTELLSEELEAQASSRAERRMTVGEVAEVVGVHPRTIHRAIGAGELAASRVRNRWRITRHAVDDWLESGSAASSHALASQNARGSQGEPARPARPARRTRRGREAPPGSASSTETKESS